MTLKRKLLFAVHLVVLFACSEEPTPKDVVAGTTKDCSSYCVIIHRLERQLPALYSDDEHIVIWRFGSIQLSHYVSGLILKKDDLSSNREKTAVYFAFDYPIPTNRLAGRISSFYTIRLDISKLDYAKPKAIDIADMALVEKKLIVDEGICSNIFLLKEYGEQEVTVVNGNKTLARGVYKLFSQISPSEHLQSLLLIDQCKDDSVVNRIYSAYKKKDSEDYLLNVEPNLSSEK